MAPCAALAVLHVPVADGFDMHGDFGTGWWIAMMLGMLVFWTLVIGAVVWVVREVSGRREARAGTESAQALLDRRFASGEISIEEYHQRKAVLGGEVETPPGHDT